MQCKKFLLDKCQAKFFKFFFLPLVKCSYFYLFLHLLFISTHLFVLCLFLSCFALKTISIFYLFCKTLCKVFKKNIEHKNKVFFLINNSIYEAISISSRYAKERTAAEKQTTSFSRWRTNANLCDDPSKRHWEFHTVIGLITVFDATLLGRQSSQK